MNLQQIKKQVGTNLRLRPQPIRIGHNGEELSPVDDEWRLDEVSRRPSRLRLVNISTHHVVELQADNVKEYRSPHFLFLRCQLTISSKGIEIEPFVDPPARRMVPIARYQQQKYGIMEQHVPVRPAVCQACTAAVEFRPLVRIKLPAYQTWPDAEEQLCPPCASDRGIPVLIPTGMDEATVFGRRNPSFKYHMRRLLKDPVLPALTADEDLCRLGVSNVGAAVTGYSVTLLVSGHWSRVIEAPMPFATLDQAGIRSEGELMQYAKNRVLDAIERATRR